MFAKENNRLIINDNFGTVWIEPWGTDSVRIRMTADRVMDKNDWALGGESLPDNAPACSIEINDIDTTYPWAEHFANVEKTTGQTATLTNGRLQVRVNHEGWISFWQLNETGTSLLFEEQWRNRARIDRFCVPTNNPGRELKQNPATFNYKATVRFEAYDDEKIFGMGQYQDSHLDKKGGSWELAQKNSQASVPFIISTRGYGFLWNNPAIGTATFGTNGTSWTAEQTQKIDYWVTCGTPSEIEKNYTDVTGRTPMMPDFAMGFWQCKLRYRTQQEVIEVAKEYRRRNLPLDVIVIDFFHWSCQGDFKFDPEDWPDPEQMVRELGEMGVKLMVSVWPTIDERSENFDEMSRNGLLISFDRKNGFNMDWMGNTVFFDATNPAAQKYVWEKCKENYFKKGIQLFWLDEAEPEYGLYEFEHYKYHIGPAMECSNIYPYFYAKAFYDGLCEEKQTAQNEATSQTDEAPLSLIRCAWAGSQKFGTVVWSGDVHSDFRSLRNQIQAGLSMAIAGIPWWTTDIGGFLGGDIKDPDFHELLIRWFEWACFCPVMRLHGERPPFKVLDKPYHEIRGHQIKQMESGQDNEVWSFGDDVYKILVELLNLRTRLKPYIKTLMQEAHTNGTPVMRPLMYDFYTDPLAVATETQYMFGPKLLVCPITQAKATSRQVYLPLLPVDELWYDTASGNSYTGGQTIQASAPLHQIPVFSRGKFEVKIW
jgi:alpha-D-xyloside xylohydrolase